MSAFLCPIYDGDLNDVIKPGIYNINENALNRPDIADNWSFIIHLVHAATSDYATQIAIPMNSNKDFVCMRHRNGGIWGAWNSFLTNDDLFNGNILVLAPENNTNGEGGQINLAGATGYKTWIIDNCKDVLRLISDSIVFEFKTDGIYLNGRKIC